MHSERSEYEIVLEAIRFELLEVAVSLEGGI